MRVVITRPQEQSGPFAALLQARGAQAIHFPAIAISPPEYFAEFDRSLARLAEFDWLVFTSANAVAAVLDRLAAIGGPFPAGPKIAATGPQTAAALAARGLAPDFVPDEYLAAAIVPGLGDLAGRRVFLPLADLAEDTLEKAVAAAGGIAVRVTVYHTRPARPDPEALAEIQRGVDAIAFTSPSTARNFTGLVAAEGLDPFRLPGSPLIACIGPRTAAAARQLGYSVDLVAGEYTVEGLVDALFEAAARRRSAADRILTEAPR